MHNHQGSLQGENSVTWLGVEYSEGKYSCLFKWFFNLAHKAHLCPLYKPLEADSMKTTLIILAEFDFR
jgi:hypothetical protein